VLPVSITSVYSCAVESAVVVSAISSVTNLGTFKLDFVSISRFITDAVSSQRIP
jgi:hypothetical protein